ncbi:DUF4926 domain-containing protein [Pigmentiphaga sp.]|uniref:DUF4926 domain-containing protein n=1 Tax=Pigmentiphaga sp. TaxID=1977564 RepID=UPI00128CD2BB|nr:DUF4926 domain-containing protein [Alcaligenaceae bacterium SAGV5]MPS50280.1 DUF4926 domain-containing protein [Alcaligenaceae bacterium SAGV3]MPT56505.1 DUF4926 domain-containing protein [Alcaligenaceae bacterium]
MCPKINDTVRLLEAFPDEALEEGALGVIVAEFSEPDEAYEIEFSDENGATIAQIALRPSQFSVVI